MRQARFNFEQGKVSMPGPEAYQVNNVTQGQGNTCLKQSFNQGKAKINEMMKFGG